MKLGVIAEDSSDVDTLKVLIRRIAGRENLPIKGPSFEGCGQMLLKGAKHIKLLLQGGFTHFVVCYDSDGKNPAERKARATKEIQKAADLDDSTCCIVIPIQEIEAWFLADLPSVVPKVFKGSRDPPAFNEVEKIDSPKEKLMAASRQSNRKPRYNNAVHNPQLAMHVDIATVRSKCRSFVVLHDFINDICKPSAEPEK